MGVSPLVEIVCDGSERIGMGHVRRSQTLAQQLSQEGVPVRLRGLSAVAQALLPAIDDKAGRPRIQVIDVPEAPADLVGAARQAGQIIVGLDWFGEDEVDVNVVIYPHQGVRARRAMHVGWPFVMIRHEIAQRGRASPSGGGQRVLVFLGGGDVLGQAHPAAALLSRAGLDVVLVQGPLASDRSAGTGYEVKVNPPDLPELLAGCDWAVTNGGTCMFESLCLGKPPYVLPQTEAEWRVSASIASHGALLGSGLEGLHVFGADLLRTVALQGQGLIDGAGVRRVSKIVRELL